MKCQELAASIRYAEGYRQSMYRVYYPCSECRPVRRASRELPRLPQDDAQCLAAQLQTHLRQAAWTLQRQPRLCNPCGMCRAVPGTVRPPTHADARRIRPEI